MHRSCQRLHLWKQNHNHGQGEKKKKHLLFVSSLKHIMERKDGKKNKGKEHAE